MALVVQNTKQIQSQVPECSAQPFRVSHAPGVKERTAVKAAEGRTLMWTACSKTSRLAPADPIDKDPKGYSSPFNGPTEQVARHELTAVVLNCAVSTIIRCKIMVVLDCDSASALPSLQKGCGL